MFIELNTVAFAFSSRIVQISSMSWQVLDLLQIPKGVHGICVFLMKAHFIVFLFYGYPSADIKE